MNDNQQSTATTRMTRLAMRVFLVLSIALILVFGLFSIQSTILETSPLARLSERLERAPWFELIRREWEPSWSLLALEDAPWVGTTAGATPLSAIAPSKGVTVVNLWATWCEPCRKEMPAMLKLARELEGAQPWFDRVPVS